MSKTLAGEQYCLAHQGNHSHYAEHNCTVCLLLAENEKQARHISRLEEALHEYGASVGEINALESE